MRSCGTATVSPCQLRHLVACGPMAQVCCCKFVAHTGVLHHSLEALCKHCGRWLRRAHLLKICFVSQCMRRCLPSAGTVPARWQTACECNHSAHCHNPIQRPVRINPVPMHTMTALCNSCPLQQLHGRIEQYDAARSSLLTSHYDRRPFCRRTCDLDHDDHQNRFHDPYSRNHDHFHPLSRPYCSLDGLQLQHVRSRRSPAAQDEIHLM
jgi:hypothetical protein